MLTLLKAPSIALTWLFMFEAMKVRVLSLIGGSIPSDFFFRMASLVS